MRGLALLVLFAVACAPASPSAGHAPGEPLRVPLLSGDASASAPSRAEDPSLVVDTELMRDVRRIADDLRAMRYDDYGRNITELAQRTGDRRVVETFLAFHAEPKARDTKESSVLFALLHELVSPLAGDAKRADECHASPLSTERRYAEALLTLAERPDADREFGPLVACIDERVGLDDRVRRIALGHPVSELRSWLISTIPRVHPRSAGYAALLREIGSAKGEDRSSALRMLVFMKEDDPRATCALLLQHSEEVVLEEKQAFVDPDAKCAASFDAYVASLQVISREVLERLRVICRTPAKGADGKATRIAYTRAVVRALPHLFRPDERSFAIETACTCSAPETRAMKAEWQGDNALEATVRRSCK